ncbi:MAG TPA: TetR/AcrR family transcriptional regulator [Dehalococcoidia bacterium]|nr:TetR/AcrR family transcriptional regulator [Dehalococcoidia bacterium]
MSGPSGLRGHRIQNVEKAEGRRREILVAAANVFARDGYASASLDDVAAQIGVTKGVIYYYFRSKEEIFTEIRATAIRDAIERLEAIVAAGGTPEQLLRAAVRDLVDHIFDDLDRYANVLSAQRLSPESHATIRELQRRYEHLVQQIVADGIGAGVFAERDPRVTTFTLLRACLGIAGWYSPDGPLPPELVAEQVTEQVVSGVLRRGC